MSRQVLTTRTTRSVPVVYPQDIKILRLYNDDDDYDYRVPRGLTPSRSTHTTSTIYLTDKNEFQS